MLAPSRNRTVPLGDSPEVLLTVGPLVVDFVAEVSRGAIVIGQKRSFPGVVVPLPMVVA